MFSWLRNYFKYYLRFNYRERLGLLTLVVVLLVLNVFLFRADKILRPQPKNFDKEIALVDSFYRTLRKAPEANLSRLDKYIIKRYDTIDLFKFNPNTATKEDLKLLGLTNKQVRNIIAYRQRGGRFLVKDDFRKIYGIRHRQYLILKPYIDLPDKTSKPSPLSEHKANNQHVTLFYFDPNTITYDSLIMLGFSPKQAASVIKAQEKGWKFRVKSDFKKLYAVDSLTFERLRSFILLPDTLKINRIELNTATGEQLVSLPGIGEYYAAKIIKYRDLLGGYCCVEQLYEVYRLPATTVDKIKPYLWCDTTKIVKLNLNKSEFKDFVRHPYFDSDMAGWIVRHRQKKPFVSVLDVNMKGFTTKENFKKLRFYLEVD